ncbi:hypothetical protein GZH53_09975 [Flavihumibacter sp. R14]|nr:hypothetical protein [Flavihumibacter soli]
MDDKKHSFWDFKLYEEGEWFRFLSKSLLLLVGIYLVLHWSFRGADHYGDTNFKLDYEYAKLDDRQKQIVNRIYFDSLNKNTNESNTDAQKGKGDTLVTGKPGPPVGTIREVKNKIIKSSIPPAVKALTFLKNEFNNKIDSTQLDSMQSYLLTASNLDAVSYLSEARLQVKSYFWLTGPAVYFEIIFWSLFGVLSSLLFNLSLVARNRSEDELHPRVEFDSNEIPYQVAKLLYAPFCSLILILGYNYFKDANIADISSSKGVIVFAFISGFYSARVIAFLDRLKEVLLPPGKTDTGTDKKKFEVESKPPLPIEPPVEPGNAESDIEEEGVNTADINFRPPLPAKPVDENPDGN